VSTTVEDTEVGTELAVIEDEGVSTETEVLEPLSEKAAKALDKKIRSAGDKVETTMANLMELLKQAYNGQIHKALGLPSWTAYVKDSVRIAPRTAEERRVFVTLMNDKGMSTRAIADVVGTNQSTVSRDLKGAEHDADASPVTVGTDGKEYARNEEEQTEVIDAEVVEEPSTPKPRALARDFEDEVTNAWNAVAELVELTNDDRFAKARKSLSKHVNTLGEVSEHLQSVVDKLMA
jgi:transposase